MKIVFLFSGNANKDFVFLKALVESLKIKKEDVTVELYDYSYSNDDLQTQIKDKFENAGYKSVTVVGGDILNANFGLNIKDANLVVAFRPPPHWEQLLPREVEVLSISDDPRYESSKFTLSDFKYFKKQNNQYIARQPINLLEDFWKLERPVGEDVYKFNTAKRGLIETKIPAIARAIAKKAETPDQLKNAAKELYAPKPRPLPATAGDAGGAAKPQKKNGKKGKKKPRMLPFVDTTL
ncbi:MAG: hypothetical protein CL678_00305 [Bdellovibrionaceae bacterium]|nr:hypothetical protein [Pseudobdellovibrionaceae bacterium]